VKIILNGEPRDIEPGETVQSLLVRLGIDPRRVAVEWNLEIRPRSLFEKTALSGGDRVEIVHFVGGG
jgi:thiamine biosynthesis protein ThiS